MRFALVILTLAASVAAAPSVRWLDATGGLQIAGVKRLVDESGSVLKLELQKTGKDLSKDPRMLDLPLARLLEFVREDEQNPEQGRLLLARMSVRAGFDFDKSVATLDVIAEKASEAWMREYAAAFRAIAARKRGDKDASERIKRFLRAHPKSRFVSEVLRERAWLESLAQTEKLNILSPFGEAFKAIGKRGGPLRQQYGCLHDSAVRNTVAHISEMTILALTLSESIKERRPNPTLAELSVRHTVEAEWRVVAAGFKWREAVAVEVPTAAFREMLGMIENGADLLMPDTRVELRLEQAALAIATKRYKDAARYFELAGREQASYARRMQLERAKRQLERLREKR